MILLLAVLAFLFASLIVTAGALVLSGGENAIERRLGELGGGGEEKGPVVSEAGYSRAMLDALKKIGTAAPKPSSETGSSCDTG